MVRTENRMASHPDVFEIMMQWRLLEMAERAVRRGDFTVPQAAFFFHVSEAALEHRFAVLDHLPEEPF